MGFLDALLQGFAVALTPTNLLLALFGCFAGTIIGALPGLGRGHGRGPAVAAVHTATDSIK